jgi:hypothetical protein
LELPPVETPEYKSVLFGEPSRPSSLDMELDLISEDTSMLASPHVLVDYHFFLMESVSVSAVQPGGRCPLTSSVQNWYSMVQSCFSYSDS